MNNLINRIDRLSGTAVLVGALVATLVAAAAVTAVVLARPSQSHASSEPNPVGYFNVGCVSDRNPAGGFRMGFENRMPADQAQDFVTAECPEFALTSSPALKDGDSYCPGFPAASVGSCFAGNCSGKPESDTSSTGG